MGYIPLKGFLSIQGIDWFNPSRESFRRQFEEGEKFFVNEIKNPRAVYIFLLILLGIIALNLMINLTLYRAHKNLYAVEIVNNETQETETFTLKIIDGAAVDSMQVGFQFRGEDKIERSFLVKRLPAEYIPACFTPIYRKIFEED